MKPLLVLLSIFVSTGYANLIANGSFETPVPNGTSAGYFPGDNIGAWLVTGAQVSLLTSSYTENWSGQTLTWNSEDGNQNLDITGSGNTLTGSVEQSVPTTIGADYTLSFFAGNMDNNAPAPYTLASSIQLLLNGASQGTFSNNDNTTDLLNWKQFSVSFIATSSSTLVQFVNATAGDNEAGLDNVVLNASAVPEPTTAPLLGLAAATLLLRAWRARS